MKTSGFYVAFPDKVERVTIVAEGDGGRNLKRRLRDPIVVRNASDRDEYVVERSEICMSATAAAIRSAELASAMADEYGDPS